MCHILPSMCEYMYAQACVRGFVCVYLCVRAGVLMCVCLCVYGSGYVFKFAFMCVHVRVSVCHVVFV